MTTLDDIGPGQDFEVRCKLRAPRAGVFQQSIRLIDSNENLAPLSFDLSGNVESVIELSDYTIRLDGRVLLLLEVEFLEFGLT